MGPVNQRKYTKNVSGSLLLQIRTILGGAIAESAKSQEWQLIFSNIYVPNKTCPYKGTILRKRCEKVGNFGGAKSLRYLAV